VARLNNCIPKKVEALQQTLGAEGSTLYRVACVLPQKKDDNAPRTADALLVECSANLCALLRPVILENR
jgi:hypothetical protein